MHWGSFCRGAEPLRRVAAASMSLYSIQHSALHPRSIISKTCPLARLGNGQISTTPARLGGSGRCSSRGGSGRRRWRRGRWRSRRRWFPWRVRSRVGVADVRVNVRCVWVAFVCCCFVCDCVLELVCRVRFARVSCPWLRFCRNHSSPFSPQWEKKEGLPQQEWRRPRPSTFSPPKPLRFNAKDAPRKL